MGWFTHRGNHMLAGVLDDSKAFVSPGWAISLLKCTNRFRKCFSPLVEAPL